MVRGTRLERLLKPRRALIMSIRFRIARTLLIAVLGCGLALGVNATGAAAYGPGSVSVVGTPNPVPEGAKVTLLATASEFDGQVDFTVASSGVDLGTFQTFNQPVSLTVPVSKISTVPGPVTIDATFIDVNRVYGIAWQATAATTLTVEPALDSLYVADYGSDAISIFGTGAVGRSVGRDRRLGDAAV